MVSKYRIERIEKDILALEKRIKILEEEKSQSDRIKNESKLE